jgi:hypothetical protein
VKRTIAVVGLAVSAATLVAAGRAAAQEPAASFGARDPAAIGCALFTEMAEKAPSGTERQFYDWTQGYFAGRSAADPGGLRLASDGPGRVKNYQYLLDYCAKNPAANFEAAVLSLWDQNRRP